MHRLEKGCDGQGRMKTLKTCRPFSGNWAAPGKAYTTKWNYNAYRDWLDKMCHVDKMRPDHFCRSSRPVPVRKRWRDDPLMETVLT